MADRHTPPLSGQRLGRGRSVFLLLERNPIIAADMTSILDMAVACHVVQVDKPEDVLTALVQIPKLSAAFLELNASELAGTDIATALDLHKAAIVLTRGEEQCETAKSHGWHVLPRPFTEKTMKDMLDALSIERGPMDT